MTAVQAPLIPIVSRWIAETPGTISLGQGVVSWGPPPEAIAALSAFPAAPGDHRYGPDEGLPELIDVITAKLASENRITARGNRVIVTAGGNQAFMNAVLGITDIGDEVILPVPFYFNHDMAITMVGCTPVRVPTTDRYELSLDAIEAAITPRTRAILTVSPNNPSGAVYSEDSLRRVNALCRDRGLFHITDEVYEYFAFDDAKHFSPASIDGAAEWTISMFSLSKAYGMASWRVGYMTVPEALFETMLKIQDTIPVCAAHPSQRAAIAALRHGRAWTEQFRPTVARMRERAYETLSQVARVPRVSGAFYYLIEPRTSLDPLTLCERLIREHRVAVMPGTAFGVDDRCTVRVSFGALEEATAGEGLDRLASGLRALAG